MNSHPIKSALRLLRLGAMVAACCADASAADESDGRAFVSQVAPILQRHCADCHSSETAENGLDLSSAATVFRGSEGGAVVTPGAPAESLLLQVLAKDAKPHMPPDEQLSDEEIATLSKWIDGLPADAVAVTRRITDEDRQHWAFRPLVRPAVPAADSSDWSRTPVDQFVFARLLQDRLSPSPEADKATLLRRAYFDLIGLPPTPGEVEEFTADERPDAWERAIERLLASPHYGERWGRHWLDLARYADSSGFHNDLDRPHAWRYRDYVIASFNADKPYGDFVREQLAGDELPEADAESWIATGFGRNGPTNEGNMGMGVELEKYRLDQLDGLISTTSNVFLGLTIGCARCHDHKYDPIAQRDYYRFSAYFGSVRDLNLALEGFAPASPVLSASPTKPAAKEDTSLAAMVLTDRGQQPRETRILWRGEVSKPGPVVTAGFPAVLAAASPAPTGDTSGEATTDSQNDRTGRRTELAEWIAGSDNPLTWRVMANRMWQHHFGAGLVGTPSNFGRLGAVPTHPELLDWLAVELRDSNGSLKSLHRTIVTSAVYRQSSRAEGSGQKSDPENQLLWRMSKRRLEAEPLRDAFLAVAGNLNPAMGGPGVKPRIRADLLTASQRNKWPIVKEEGPEVWRRSVYVYVKRQLQLPMMELFDSPATTHSCGQREESLVPTQALILMNDEFVREQAKDFAIRIQREAGDDSHKQAERAFLIALGRAAERKRVEDAVGFLEAQAARLTAEGQTSDAARRAALADLCHVLMNLSEFVYVD